VTKRRQYYKKGLKPYFDCKRLRELGVCINYSALETLSGRCRSSAEGSSMEKDRGMGEEGRV